MHEAVLAGNLFRIAKGALEGRKGVRVRRVNVLAGELAGVMPDALCFAFDALKPGTPFAQAEMVIRTQPVCLNCGDCGAEYRPDAFPWACPSCGRHAFRIVDGEDVILESLELEE